MDMTARPTIIHKKKPGWLKLLGRVILCYHCNQMLVTTKNVAGKQTHTAYTEFNFVRPTLVKLAKEAFPKDAEIRGLQERR